MTSCRHGIMVDDPPCSPLGKGTRCSGLQVLQRGRCVSWHALPTSLEHAYPVRSPREPACSCGTACSNTAQLRPNTLVHYPADKRHARSQAPLRPLYVRGPRRCGLAAASVGFMATLSAPMVRCMKLCRRQQCVAVCHALGIRSAAIRA